METSTHNNWKIVKLGGSILVPEFADGKLLSEFREIILSRVELGEKFIIMIGGGYVCRKYQEALVDAGVSDYESQNWMGVFTTRFNAEFIRLGFGDTAHPEILVSPDALPENIEHSIIVCGADQPGRSSNYDAVLFARNTGAKQVINLSNIDYVYNADPQANPDAIKYPEVSWAQYRTFIPTEFTPGLSTPFDPVASERAQALDIDVVFMKGSPIQNLKNYLETGEVEGSVISNRFE